MTIPRLFHSKIIEFSDRLPIGTKIICANIYEDSTEHICDEDMAQIKLSNGIIIDAGQYGNPSFFSVSVISQLGHWVKVETSLCQTTQEVVADIIRLCNKYTNPFFEEIALRFGKTD